MKLKKLFKFAICILSLILTIIYIIYRIFYTLPTTLGTLSLIFAVIILLVEIWESIDFFTYFINILLLQYRFDQRRMYKCRCHSHDPFYRYDDTAISLNTNENTLDPRKDSPDDTHPIALPQRDNRRV